MRHKIKPSGRGLIMGDRSAPLPDDAVISVTRGEGFHLWPFLLNTVANILVIFQMRKDPGLIYAELSNAKGRRGGQTLTVWRGRAMAQFRDRGSHSFAMKKLGWTFFSGQTHAYFYTWKANGRIPTAEEAEAIVKEKGKHFIGGELVRKATRSERS